MWHWVRGDSSKDELHLRPHVSHVVAVNVLDHAEGMLARQHHALDLVHGHLSHHGLQIPLQWFSNSCPRRPYFTPLVQWSRLALFTQHVEAEQGDGMGGAPFQIVHLQHGIVVNRYLPVSPPRLLLTAIIAASQRSLQIFVINFASQNLPQDILLML